MGATNVYVQRPAIVVLQSMTEEVDEKKSKIENNLKTILVLDKKEIENGLWEEVEYLIKNEKDKNRKCNVSDYCDSKIDDKSLQNIKKKKKSNRKGRTIIEVKNDGKEEKQVNNETSTVISNSDKNSSDAVYNRNKIYLKKNISVVTSVWIEKCWERKCAVSISFDSGGVILPNYLTERSTNFYEDENDESMSMYIQAKDGKNKLKKDVTMYDLINSLACTNNENNVSSKSINRRKQAESQTREKKAFESEAAAINAEKLWEKKESKC